MCVVDVFIVPTCDISELRWVSIIGWRLCAQGGRHAWSSGGRGGGGREECLHLTPCPYTSQSWELEVVCTGTFYLLFPPNYPSNTILIRCISLQRRNIANTFFLLNTTWSKKVWFLPFLRPRLWWALLKCVTMQRATPTTQMILFIPVCQN